MNRRRQIIEQVIRDSLNDLQKRDNPSIADCAVAFAYEEGETVARINLASLPETTFLFALQGLYVIEQETGKNTIAPMRYEWLDAICIRRRWMPEEGEDREEWSVEIEDIWVDIAAYDIVSPIALICSNIAEKLRDIPAEAETEDFFSAPSVFFAMRQWEGLDDNDPAETCLDILSRDHYVNEQDWGQLVSSSMIYDKMAESDMCLFFLRGRTLQIDELRSFLQWHNDVRKMVVLQEYIPMEDIQDFLADGCDIFFLYMYDNASALLKQIQAWLETKKIPSQDERLWLGDRIFAGCVSLSALSIDKPVSYRGREFFFKCQSLESFAFAQGTRYVPARFFRHSGIKQVALAESMRSLGEYAFDGCHELGEIRLPDRLERIGEEAFRDCTSLKSIRIPAGCRIEKGAFAGCTGLVQVVFGDTGLAEDNCVIPAQAFKDCRQLKEVYLPASVEEIGASAFAGCSGLETFHASDIQVGEYAFAGCRKLSNMDARIESLASHAFEDCQSLPKIQLKRFIEDIPPYAFHGCQSLQKMALPEYCDSIGDHAFEDCLSLQEFDLTGSEYVGEYAFAGCISLRNVYWEEYVNIMDYAFKGCTCLNLSIDDFQSLVSFSRIPKNAFAGCRQIVDVVNEYFGEED